MYSKFIALLLTVACLGACNWQPFKNLKLGDKSPPPGSLQLNLGKLSCMSQVGKKVDQYMAGTIKVSEVRNFMGCIRTALDKFTTFERGEIKNAYTPGELTKFLNRYYLGDEPLTDAFAAQIMKVKVVILGGDSEKITFGEIENLKALVSAVENEAVANLQYMPLYTFSKDVDVKNLRNSDFVNMRNQLQETASFISKQLSAQNKAYDLKSLNDFLVEMRKFLRWDASRPDAQAPEQTVAIISAYKNVVTGKDDPVIHPDEWAPLLDSVGSIFGIYVGYKLQIINVALTAGPGLDALVNTVGETTSLVGRIIDHNPKKMIAFTASDDLIDTLANYTKVFPEGLRANSLKEAYKFLIQKAFRNPLNSKKDLEVVGLTRQELSEMQSEFQLWADGQRYLSDNATRALNLNTENSGGLRDAFAGALQGFDFRQFIFKGAVQGDHRATEIERIVESVPAFFKVGDERAYILPSSELTKFGVFNSVADLTRMNTIRALLRLLIRGAATDDRIILMNKDWVHTGITEDEMQGFFDKVHDLGVDLKMFDPRKENSGRRSFSEGKLFTFAGNGINAPDGHGAELLNFVQGLEYLGTIWSGGHVRDLVYANISQRCKDEGVMPGPPDQFGMAKLDRKCFVRNFFKDGLKDFANLPRLRKDLNGRSNQEKAEFISAMQVIAKSPCYDPNFIELGEIANIATVLHYVEVIFTMYDVDRNGSLSGLEVMHAFKRFSGYLDRQVQVIRKKRYSVSFLKAIFAYLVQNQELPSGIGASIQLLSDKIYYYNNDVNQYEGSNPPEAPTMQIDRIGLINVLRVLATAGSAPTAPGICSRAN